MDKQSVAFELIVFVVSIEVGELIVIVVGYGVLFTETLKDECGFVGLNGFEISAIELGNGLSDLF